MCAPLLTLSSCILAAPMPVISIVLDCLLVARFGRRPMLRVAPRPGLRGLLLAAFAVRRLGLSCSFTLLSEFKAYFLVEIFH